MFRLVKFLVLLALVAGIGLVGFAYLGDLSAPVQPVSAPVSLDVR